MPPVTNEMIFKMKADTTGMKVLYDAQGKVIKQVGTMGKKTKTEADRMRMALNRVNKTLKLQTEVLVQVAMARTKQVQKVKQATTASKGNTEAVKRNAKAVRDANNANAHYTKGLKSQRLTTAGLREAVGRLRNQMLLMVFAWQLITRVIKPMLELSIKQEFAERKLEAAFYGSGKATKAQVQELKKLADQLQATTIFGNEQIINAQAMLATFQLNADQVEQLTIRMLDMATAVTDVTGKEANLQQVAIALGKGVTGNIGILSRYGVVLSAEAKRTGDFSLIMKELDKNFKGIAEAMKTTFMGQMKMTGNAMGDLQKQMGGVITQSIVIIASFDLIRESLIGATERVKDAREKTDNFTDSMKRFVHGILLTLAVLKLFWVGFRQGIRVIVLFIGKILELIMKIPILAQKFKNASATIKEFNKILMEDLEEGAEDLTKINEGLTSQIEKLELRMNELGGTSTDILNKMKDAMHNLGDATIKEADNMKTVLNDVKNTLQSVFFDFMVNEMKTVEDYWKAFTRAILKSWTTMLADMMVKALFWEAVWTTLKIASGGMGGAIGGVTGAAKAMPAFAGAQTLAHQGGYNDRGRIKRRHAGGTGSGETDVRILDEEGIVNRRGMGMIGREGLAAINRGQPSGKGSTVNHFYINAMDVKSFREYLMQQQDIFVGSIQSNLESNDSLRKLFKGGI